MKSNKLTKTFLTNNRNKNKLLTRVFLSGLTALIKTLDRQFRVSITRKRKAQTVPFKKLMKILFLILFITFNAIIRSQTIIPIGIDYDELKIMDTLAINSDSVLTKLGYFENNTLVAECTAYLIPVLIDEPRFPHITRRYFFRKAAVTQIVRHGTTVEYIKQYSRVSEYSQGKLVSITAYDKEKNQISPNDFPIKRRLCGEMKAEFLVDGIKKSK